MDIQKIDKNLLTSLHEEAKQSPRLRMNFDLRTSSADQSQRMLNALEPGTLVPIHQHTETTETIICIEGSLDVILYDNQDVSGEAAGTDSPFRERMRITLSSSGSNRGLQIPVGVWHTVEVKEPATIFEAKDGAYVPR